MSKSVAFLYLLSRFPTIHGHQGFVYRKEMRGLLQCYQFVCGNLHTVHTVIKFCPPPPSLPNPFPPNQYAIERMTYKTFSFRGGNAEKKIIGFCFSKFTNLSGKRNATAVPEVK